MTFGRTFPEFLSPHLRILSMLLLFPTSVHFSYQSTLILINIPTPGHWPHSSRFFLPFPLGLAVPQKWLISMNSARNRDLSGLRDYSE